MITRYEVELIIGGTRLRLGFSARKTRAALLDYARANAEKILPHIGEDDEWIYKAGCVRFNDKVSVRFTGRTERDYKNAARLGREVV